MLLTMVKKEILNNLLNHRFVVTYFVSTTLMIGSAAIGIGQYRDANREYVLGQSLHNRAFRDSEGSLVYWQKGIVLRKPAVLSALAIGGERDTPGGARVNAFEPPEFQTELTRSPLANLFPPADMVFVVGVVLSLLVVLLCFDSVAGEREEGTLKLLLASPVPRHQLVLAKWLGGLASLGIPFVTSCIAVLLLFAFSRDIQLTAGLWVRAALILTVCALYLVTVFSVCTMVSVLLRRSSACALLLLSLWVVTSLLVPGTAPQAAWLAVRPQGAHVLQVEGVRSGTVPWVRDHITQAQADSALVVEQFGLQQNGSGLSPDEANRLKRIRVHGFHNTKRSILEGVIEVNQGATRFRMRVAQLTRLIDRATPFGCMRDACENLAGTGPARERTWRSALEDYARLKDQVECEQGLLRLQDVPSVPSHLRLLFTPPRDRLGTEIHDVLLDIALLTLMNLFSLLVAHRAFLRMDVT